MPFLPNLRRATLAAALLTLLCAVVPAAAQATHEQGGYITASITADGHLKGKVSYLTAGSCTVGTPTGQYPISIKSPLGTTQPVNTDTATYTRCVPGSTTQTAPFDIDLATTFSSVAPDGVYQVTFSSCCRISGSRNVTSTATSFGASVRKITGQTTSAPVLQSNVATGIAVGYEYAQNLNAYDPDGGTLSYQSRAGQTDGPSTDIVTYSADGWVRIPAATTATFSNGWTFVYKARVVDSQGDYAERDVLLRTTTNNKPPVFGDPGSAITVAPGETKTVNIAASDPNNASPKVDTVSIAAAGLPSWATITATPGNPATATLTLSPPANQALGSYGVNLDAIDNDAVAPLMTTANVQVQVAPPGPDITNGPSSPAKTATFEFSGTGAASYECQIDNGGWNACSSPYSPTGLSDGSHTFEVRTVTGDGTRTGSDSHTWTKDATGPSAPTVSSAPAAKTESRNPHFEFTGAEGGGSFECSLDSAAWSSCSSPVDLTGVPVGSRTFKVRQLDALGNEGTPATHTWEAGYVAPAPSIGSAPADPARTATFEFSHADATGFECRIDGGTWDSCSSPYSPTGLSDASHEFEVRAIVAGDERSAIADHTWTRDTTGPLAPNLTAAPVAKSGSLDAQFEFTGAEGGGTFECSVDDAAYAPCTSPDSRTGLSAGNHKFSVRQVDAAGNPGAAATHLWEAGFVPGVPSISSAPATVARTAAFEFSGTDATGYECRIDGGSWSGCASPYTAAGLADGSHKFEVRSTVVGGQSAPAEHVWTLDTSGPAAPAIVGAPASPTEATSATFEFAGEAGGSFECSLDGGSWSACVSPAPYDGLAAGKHTFSVRQTDAAGNAGSPASFEWQAGVKKADPPVDPPVDPGTPPVNPPVTGTLDPVLPPNATAEVKGDTAVVGCKVEKDALESCGIRAYALDQPDRRHAGVVDSSSKLAAAAKKPHWVFIGRGFVRSGAGASRLAVDIKLNARGRRLMARSIAGIQVKLKMRAKTVSGARIATKKHASFVPARQLVVPSTGTFESGKARLTLSGRRFLRRVARHLEAARAVRCVGHTDSVGSEAYNQALGKSRAAAACRYLRRHGVDARFVVKSHGEARPRATNATAAGRALNRRIELKVRYR